LKACEEINPAEAQLINYLKATNIEVGYVLNFGKMPRFSRKVIQIIEKYSKNKNAIA
jgi:GxxExxY protein